jgi:hypothetical protein
MIMNDNIEKLNEMSRDLSQGNNKNTKNQQTTVSKIQKSHG